MDESRSLQRMRDEHQDLDAQVKLLARTEQRMFRARVALDRELERIRALGEFALQCTTLEHVDDILRRAGELLRHAFRVERVVALRFDPDRGPTWLFPPQDASAASPSMEVVEEFLAEDDARTVRIGTPEELPRSLIELFRCLGPRADVEIEVGVSLRIIPSADDYFLFAYKTTATRKSFQRETPSADHETFFALLANHLEHALQNAALTRNLAERGRELSESNERLSASLLRLERAERQLQQSRRLEAVGRLAGGIAHDFNNLLTVIMHHAEALRADRGTGDEDALRILEASGRAAKITRQLLAFSRREPRQPEWFGLNELAAGMTRMADSLAGDTIDLQWSLDPSLPNIRADRSQIEQVLFNLLLNARDAMPGGGAVVIETRVASEADRADAGCDPGRGSFVTLSVRDPGVGMDESVRARMFEPFFTTKHQGEGSGLGLAVVYGAVSQHEGHLVVDSVPGRGTTVRVLLPISAGFGAVAQGADSAPAVLLVEDDEAIRRVVARALREQGFAVRVAPDGESALGIVREGGVPVDVLVTDVVMPRMGGGRLADALRTMVPELSVVFVSGYGASELGDRELGRNEHFLAKPFTPDVLVRAIRTALAQRSARLG